MPSKNIASINEIELILKKNNPKANIKIVRKAYDFAKKWHKGQKRASGEDFISHPLEIAKMMAEKKFDEQTIAAALLHDTIEDTKVNKEEIRKAFGKEIAELVSDLTKLQIAAFKSRKQQSAANTVRTLMRSSDDIRVLLIKIYDKLHNLRTLKYLKKNKQRRIAADALSIYVPIAHKMCMHDVKYEMEDICFEILDHKNYLKTKKEVTKIRKRKKQEIKKAMEILKRKFPETKWRFEEKTKSMYTIYGKILFSEKTFAQINDCIILKIIVPEKEDCYEALGKVHMTFSPIPEKVKDFIGLPEYGIYRSIHTQVIGPAQIPMKVYIFSEEMNKTASDGVVHLLSCGNKKSIMEAYKELFPVISSPRIEDNEGLARALNLDFHQQSMFVFSEKGKTINLPRDSTALDLAFFHNEKKAPNAMNAKVNGKKHPIWKKLHTGDIVKIIYSKKRQIKPKWLMFANSSKAREKIEKELKWEKTEKKNDTLKISMEASDAPGMFAKQTRIIAKNGMDIEMSRSTTKIEKEMFHSEFYIKKIDKATVQKTISQLKGIKGTKFLAVEYI